MKREFRKAALEDIAIIRSIAEVAFRETYKTILSAEQIDYMMKWMYSEESLRYQMGEKGHVYYLLSLDDTYAGYVSFERHASPPADLDGYTVFNLQKLYLLPDYQGTGFGSCLLAFAEDRMRLWAGASARVCYELNVNRYNRAVTFYQRLGLKVNREGDFPIGNGYYMNDYIMRKFL